MSTASERAQMLLDRRKNINPVLEERRWCTWVDDALNLTLEAMSRPIPKEDA